MTDYRTIARAHYEPHCDLCRAEDEPLEVHHRNGNHQDHDVGNLQLLCHPCHVSEHLHMRHGDAGGFDERVFARLTPTTASALRATAKEAGVTMSEVVRIAIEEYLERREKVRILEPLRKELLSR